MPALEVIHEEIWEDSGVTLLARVTGNDAAYITQASLTAISWQVFDTDSDTPETAIATGACTVASSVFDTLQTDGYWTRDSTGYNFRYTMAASSFPSGGHSYVVEVIADPVDGDDFPIVVAELDSRKLRSS